MALTNALTGIQNATASFDSAAKALIKAVTPNTTARPDDTAQLSDAAVGLLKSQTDVSANIATAVVENNLTKTTLSVLA